MARNKNKNEFTVFGLSFVDVFANTLGGLAFILILVILLIGLKFGIPSINTERLPNAFSGVPYEVWMSANEGGGLYNWTVVKGELPKGIVMDDTIKGLLSGTPIIENNETKKEYQFTMRVDVGETAKEYVDEKEFKITVFSNPFGNLKLTTESKLPNAIAGQPYPLTFAAEGGKGPYIWTIKNIIAGLKLTQTGVFQGTVKANSGNYSPIITVSDQYNNSVTKKFSVEVIEVQKCPTPPDLVIVTDSLPSAIVGKKYNLALSAQGGFGNYQWSGNTNLKGLLVDSSGYLRGTPTATGEFKLNVKVKDIESRSARKSDIKLEVLEAPRNKIAPLKILTPYEIPKGSKGDDYLLNFAADGGTPPYSWKLINNDAGFGSIKITKEGALTIKPSNIGELKFKLELKDELGESYKKEFLLVIVPPILPLKIVTKKISDAVKEFKFEYNLFVMGGYPPYDWEMLNIEKLPKGLSFVDGTIKGTPKEAGSYNLALEVKDEMGTKISGDLPFEVLESGKGVIEQKLKLLTDTIPSMLSGKEIDFHIATVGGGYPKLWVLEGDLPSGVSFSNGYLHGNPNEVGQFLFSVQVTSPTGQVVEAPYTLEIKRMVDFKWRLVAIIALIIGIVSLIGLIIIYRLIKGAKRKSLKILTTSIPSGRCSFPYSVYLSAEGGLPPYKWEISDGELPIGLELKSEGLLKGIPFEGVKLEDVKELIFEVKVTDKLGNSTKQKL